MENHRREMENHRLERSLKTQKRKFHIYKTRRPQKHEVSHGDLESRLTAGAGVI
jgi:hypothetical protein